MVRRSIEIKKIEDNSKRQVTFTKRRQGLFKKAKELCKKCDAKIAIVTLSMAGNVYAFGHPTVDSVIQRYKTATAWEEPSLARNDNDEENHENPNDHDHVNPDDHYYDHENPDDHDHENKNNSDTGSVLTSSLHAEDENPYKGLTALKNDNQGGDKKVQGKQNLQMPSLDLQVDELQLDELQELMAQMEEMKKKVVERANQMRSSVSGDGVQDPTTPNSSR